MYLRPNMTKEIPSTTIKPRSKTKKEKTNPYESHSQKRREMLYASGHKPSRNFGRPSNYLPEYCSTILEIADDPNTVTLIQEFCSRVHTTESRVYEWIKAHSDFKESYNLAMAKWENKFTNQCFSENKSPIFFKFLMNRQRGVHVDQTEVVHSIKNVSEIQKLLLDDDQVTDI